MKKNIRVLIIAAVLGLVALSAIQAYLINNTYKLEKEAFLEETQRAIFRFDDTIPEMDSIYDTLGEFVVKRMIDYKLGRIPKNALFEGVNHIQDSLNTRYVKLYQDAFRERNLSYPVKFQKRLKSIVLLDSIKNDTLVFKPNKTESLYMLGEQFDVKDAYGINNQQTTTDLERSYVQDGLEKTIYLEFQIVFQDYFNIDGWKSEVLSRMTSILLVSFLIFAFVFGLLYYSIKNLITQKKIADIKTDFINNITHELKTPLATLSLSTKMLQNEAVKSQPELIESTVNTIDRQTGRLQKLIDQVLNNSLGYKDIELKKEPVNVQDFLNTILDDFQVSVKDQNVSLQRHLEVENTIVRLDKFYVTTAIFNILENAVKYNSEGVTINFKTSAKNELNISISDDGIGIPVKHQNQLFEKFYRAGNTEVHNVKGLGLGLYYTNQIIKAHGGTITVESKEGNGTTFLLTIPMSK